MVLVNSCAQQILPAKQTTSIIKIQMNQSSEAQLFWGGYQGEFSLRSTWPRALCLVNFPHPWGEIVNFTILLVLPQKEADGMCNSEQRLLSYIPLELRLVGQFLFI